jgi:hypothetical protein
MPRDLSGIVLGDSVQSAVPAVALTRLVVLPFRVLRPDPEIDFLSLALADAVSTSLSGATLRGLDASNRRPCPAASSKLTRCSPDAA